MLGFKAEIFVDPSNADAFIAALKPAADKAFAEPECTLFQAYQVDDEPGHFVLIENWTEDKEWLMTASLPNVTFAVCGWFARAMFYQKGLGGSWVLEGLIVLIVT